ncbi:EamA family transporter [Schaalia sp. 19OD2882]|uniref:DMT family transporter n=1 Tax=Schaalia sp. 19OD2882 TaxID=2794089 RepID=UPI001C1EF740|nr:EamA family transporter [Schaalia sp. 19OD2882]QWW20331.1 EamA family transporter [Schaalia sp. 19OD2882]
MNHPTPRRSRDRLLGILAVLVTAAIWGTLGTAATFAPEVGPLSIGAASLGIGGLLQGLLGAKTIRQGLPHLRRHMGTILFGALMVAIHPLAFYAAVDMAGVAIGTVVAIASAPVLAGILEAVVDRHRLGAAWLLAAGIGILASALLAISNLGASATAPTHTVIGLALALVSGGTYAAYSWAAQRLMLDAVPRTAAMGSVFGLGGLMLLPVLLLTGAPLLASARAFCVAAYTALVPMFAAYVLFGYGLSKIRASTATVITLVEPAVAALLAIVVVGERLTPLAWTAVALFALVLGILTLAPSSPGPHDEATRAQ